MVHLMLLQGAEAGEVSFETDRSKFLGRDRTSAAPAALSLIRPPAPLSNSKGSVLDPIVSIRRTIRLAPDETARISLVIGLAPTRQDAMGVVEKYQDHSLADRVIELAWTHSLVVLRHLNATEPDAQLYGRLASALLYTISSGVQAPVSFRRIVADRAAFGATEFPAIFQSFSCGTAIPNESIWCGKFCKPILTGV